MEKISSKQNARIKNLGHLEKSSVRYTENLFIIEGIKEIEKALWADYEFDQLYFLPKLISLAEIQTLFNEKLPTQIFEVTEEVYSKIAYRENSGGMVAVAKMKKHDIFLHKPKPNSLYLVIEGVEKPGNIGAIYRTADAAGIDGVLLCDAKAEIYNPNAIRASLGCVFSVPTFVIESEKAIEWLNKNQISIFCTYLKAAKPYHTIDYTQSSAIVVGTEATGISPVWVQAAHANIIIPMRGVADSMNVSTSTAVVLFEACRQRNFK
jgi:TrmH family RNA methyltransferase